MKEEILMDIVINLKLCNACEKCVNFCPCDVFRMDKKNKNAIAKYAEDCMLCWLCVNNCPTKAINMSPSKTKLPLLSWG
jgi:NAD-dependent dihydropyrimidine dehydrogenase PreA subunit